MTLHAVCDLTSHQRVNCRLCRPSIGQHSADFCSASVPLLSKSYFQELRMMQATDGQRPLANAPPSQTGNTSSGLYLYSEYPIFLINTAVNTRTLDPHILHPSSPNQAQTLAAGVPRPTRSSVCTSFIYYDTRKELAESARGSGFSSSEERVFG